MPRKSISGPWNTLTQLRPGLPPMPLCKTNVICLFKSSAFSVNCAENLCVLCRVSVNGPATAISSTAVVPDDWVRAGAAEKMEHATTSDAQIARARNVKRESDECIL